MGLAWSEATAQLELEEALEIGGFGYPAMAARCQNQNQHSSHWDGKDGQLPTEEDIDLSDVDLDDIKDEL
ncbi:Protein disulfide-isomerase A6 [Eumeta japonica]|uniref:Protein disulfide-isomerase A6 n=1 Tax=Eumeta variegata TaxID=151549 RepID=A0A4C1ST13_EUMVA|nr:Protein disulfide-isomerase A6 [Eumeta japonica]